VLVDFVYTHCPGPCPILTGIHAEVQRRLPPELRVLANLVFGLAAVHLGRVAAQLIWR
jgi:cytochrome oxidase Cu insertion factor (SCO1/SenC/PrrC family)